MATPVLCAESFAVVVHFHRVEWLRIIFSLKIALELAQLFLGRSSFFNGGGSLYFVFLVLSNTVTGSCSKVEKLPAKQNAVNFE